MKVLFSILTTLIFSLHFCQKNKCELKIEIDTSATKNDGNVKIVVTNIGTKKTKILKHFSAYKAQLFNVSKYSAQENKYISENFGTADIDFLFPEKTEIIKPKKTKIYQINIFDTYQGNKFLNRLNNYNFDMYFDFVSLVDYRSKCETTGISEISNIKYEPN